jgi:hypothetical protein
MGYYTTHTWQLAEEILKTAGKPMHYHDITQRVLNSGRSRLTAQGGATPDQTVGAILRKYSKTFEAVGRGFYALRGSMIR